MTSERVILLRIKEWLFEYSAKFGMTKALKEIANNHSDLWATKDCTINPIFPLLVVLEDAVNTKDVKRYPEAIRIMELIHEQSGNLLCFRTYLKLQLCLKMMVLFDMLTRDDSSIIQKLNSYFPSTGLVCPSIDSTLTRKLSESSRNFRRLFLTLISRPSCRKKYMEEEYEQYYGKDFQAKMRRLVGEFVCDVHWAMPPTVMEKILQKPPDEAFLNQLISLPSSTLGILFENLENFDVLDEPKVLRLVELFQCLSEESELPDGPRTDGSIDAYSLALTKGFKPGDSAPHFISQFGLDIDPSHELSKEPSTNQDADDIVKEPSKGVPIEGDSSDWGVVEGSSGEPLPGSQPQTWSSLGDIPADISKGSTNQEQHVAAAPPTRVTTSLSVGAERASQDLVVSLETNLPDIQEAAESDSQKKSSPAVEPQPNRKKTPFARAVSRNTPGVSRNDSQSKDGNLASTANEVPANDTLVTERVDEPAAKEELEVNPRKPVVRVYKRVNLRETRTKKSDVNVGTSSNKKRGRDASPTPTNSKRARNDSPPANAKRPGDVGRVPANEKQDEEDDEASDLLDEILRVIDNERPINKPSQEESNKKSDQSDCGLSEGESVLVIVPLDESEAPPQENPPTSVSKEFDSSFEKCFADNSTKFDAEPRQEKQPVDRSTEGPPFQSSPEALEERLSQGFAMPLMPSASRKRPADDSGSDLELRGKRRKLESPVPSQVTSSWDSSCSSTSNERVVETSYDDESREVEDFNSSVYDYMEGIHRSNEEMRSRDEARRSIGASMRRTGREHLPAIGQESASQIQNPSTQFFSPTSSPSLGGFPSQPSSSSGTFYSCHGMSQESRIENELMTDDDSESDVNITMTEVVPKLTKKVVEPARERPHGTESPHDVQVGRRFARDTSHEVGGWTFSSEAV